VTAPPGRSRSARDIASDVVRLSRRASQIADVAPIAIADLRADPHAVERLLRRHVSSILDEIDRGESGGSDAPVAVAVAAEALALMEEWRLLRYRETARRRADTSHGLAHLRSLGTEEDIFDQVCQQACHTTGAGRAMLARIDAGGWTPWRRFDAAREGAALPEWRDATTAPLRTLDVESAVVASRGVTTVPGGPHREQPVAVRDVMRRSAYAIAPITVCDDVVGLVYATEPDTAQWIPTDLAQRLHAFVSHVGHLVERAMTFAYLEAQSAQMRDALSATSVVVAGFDTNVDLVQLVGRQQAGPTPAGAAPWTAPKSVLEQDYTPREREVMTLLAQGMDNTRIARELAVATSTVKSHLQNMLRKAGAVNRAELIAQFYELPSRVRSPNY
jgi:DNA-binding CsgD family transcriptional regulator